MKYAVEINRDDPKTEAQQVARIVSDFVNNFGVDEQGFCEAMSKQHNTLQQSFTQLCIKWLKTLAETEYYDLRNEDSVLLAKKIVEKFKDDLYLRVI